MDAPFESLPLVAQNRIIAIQKAFGKASMVDTNRLSLLEKFYLGIAEKPVIGHWLIDKSIEDAEEFVLQQFRRDERWIQQAADILYHQAESTWKDAISAQLCSSMGKKLPADFTFSLNSLRTIRERALFSAQSTAKTFNNKLPVWISQIETEYRRTHNDSLQGLNRWVLMNRMGKEIYRFNSWKDEQVAVSEFSSVWTEATRGFWDQNSKGLEVECLILPETAIPAEKDSPIVCISFAGTWQEYSMAADLSFQHPNCNHHPAQSRIKSGNIPAFMGIGGYEYLLENLEDC